MSLITQTQVIRVIILILDVDLISPYAVVSLQQVYAAVEIDSIISHVKVT